jgi:hypothetical protein
VIDAQATAVGQLTAKVRAERIEDQSLPWGRGISLCTQRWGIAPHIGRSVVEKRLLLSCLPSRGLGRFRENESHEFGDFDFGQFQIVHQHLSDRLGVIPDPSIHSAIVS